MLLDDINVKPYDVLFLCSLYMDNNRGGGYVNKVDCSKLVRDLTTAESTGGSG
jgi:hypothetical protein